LAVEGTSCDKLSAWLHAVAGTVVLTTAVVPMDWKLETFHAKKWHAKRNFGGILQNSNGSLLTNMIPDFCSRCLEIILCSKKILFFALLFFF
jgi:hypothetical protein